MAKNIDTQSEIAQVESEIASANEKLNVTVSQHAENVGQLLLRRAHLVHLGSVLQSGASEEIVTEARKDLQETSEAKAPTTELTATTDKKKLSPAEKRKANRHAKRARDLAAKSTSTTQSGDAVTTEATAAEAAPAKTGRGKGRRTKAAAAKTEASVQSAPKGRRGRKAAVTAEAATPVPSKADEPAEQTATTGSNAQSLAALDVLRHAKVPMRSGDIAERINAKPRGMGPILAPLRRDGQITKTEDGLYQAS